MIDPATIALLINLLKAGKELKTAIDGIKAANPGIMEHVSQEHAEVGAEGDAIQAEG